MRNLILAAAIAIGAFAATPTIAAPVGSNSALPPSTDVQAAQYYRQDGGWRPIRRHWDRRGRGYGRRFYGPPPHARAYGRRSHDRGYYRY